MCIVSCLKEYRFGNCFPIPNIAWRGGPTIVFPSSSYKTGTQPRLGSGRNMVIGSGMACTPR